MKRFYCDCGLEVFFEDRSCRNCGQDVGFDVESLTMLSVIPAHDGVYQSRDGHTFRQGGNWIDHDVCNWLIPECSSNRLCGACQFNRTIPNQTVIDVRPPVNYLRWVRLEEAKKRLLFTLMRLGIPIKNGWDDPQQGLVFDFLEDMNPADPEHFLPITTGYSQGVITINSIEADDVARVSAKSALNERQRTILGHFRHESGHYFWDRLLSQMPASGDFVEVFGHAVDSYRESLDAYYQNGPPNDWSENFISAYASAHPSEDWAETWNHYLLISDGLETAFELGMTPHLPYGLSIEDMLHSWRKLAVTINHLNRSIGVHDAYPFVISSKTEAKLRYVASLIDRFRRQGGAN